MRQAFLSTGLRTWFFAPSGFRVARLCGGIVMLIGILVLIGWVLDLPLLRSVKPGAATMKANTALCFVLTGISLLAHARTRSSSLTTRIAQGSAIAVLTIGALTLSQYCFGWNLGIDQLINPDLPISPFTQHPGRMGENTALNFVLTGVALIAMQQKTRRSDYVIQTTTLITIAIALLALVGHLYGVEVFYQFVVYSTSMALHTASTFLVLGVGILAARSNWGGLQTLTGDLTGSLIARRLVPAAIVVPLVVGYLILQGLRAGAYDPTLGIALFSVKSIYVLVFLVIINARKLNRIDYDRRRSSDRLRSSEERLYLAQAAADFVTWEWNTLTTEVVWSEQGYSLFGISPDDPALFDTWLSRIHTDDAEILQAAIQQCLATGSFEMEYRINHSERGVRWLLSRGGLAADNPKLMRGISFDVTNRKQAQLNEQFLNDLDLRLRQLSDADAMAQEAVKSVGEYLQVDRCLWHTIDLQADTTTVPQDWRRADLESVKGNYRLSEFILPQMIHHYQTGQPLIIEDVAVHDYTAPVAHNFAKLKISAILGVPWIESGCWVAAFAVNSHIARKWRSDEIALLQEIVRRLWSIIEQTRAVQALRQQEEQTRLAREAADLGMWFWNLPQDQLVWTDRCKALFGIAPTVQMTYEIFLSALHPDDRDRTHAAVTRALEQKVEYNIEYRTVWSDGSIHWIAARGRAFYDAAGQPVRMMGTAQDITDRKQTELTLVAQTEELIHSNRLKDEFLAALSHELRTPLNPILGWTSLMRAQRLTPEKTVEALETIDRNVRQQLRLVDDLLEVSQVIQGKLKLELRPIDLALTIQNAIDTVQFAAQTKSITLQVQDSSSLTLIADSDRLQQVFWNLLSNAIKFTPEGGQVEVELSATGDRYAQVRVTDTGVGIAPEFLPHVFDRFRQADGSSTRKFGGLGLGLSIVQQLVELHGGKVTVESPGIGQGATFTVTLPITEALLNPSPIADLHQSATEPSTAFTEAAFALTGVHILVVDDDPDNLDLLDFLLQQAGATVTALSSPRSAIALMASQLASQSFDLIISDIGMPELDGYELMQQIRALPQGHSVPALALTAFVYQADQEKAIEAGFQAYITKPVNPIELLEVATQLITHRSHNGIA